MKKTNATDAARIELLLAELRLPAMKLMWADLAARADKEGWPASRFLAALAEHEIADRGRRRIERHLAGAKLPTGKTFDTFDFNAVPMVSKAQVMALAAGDSWLDQGANIMLFGPPGGGKSHLAAALGLALVQNGRRVLFIRTTDLVQRLQVARRDLELEAAISKLDKYQLLILDDIAYVTKDQAETSVLFELIAARAAITRRHRHKGLASVRARRDHVLVRLPLLILIAAPFSPRLSRHTRNFETALLRRSGQRNARASQALFAGAPRTAIRVFHICWRINQGHPAHLSEVFSFAVNPTFLV